MEASDPVEVTAMHLVPVAPGLRLVAVNIAVLLSSSDSATVPADQLLVGLAVVAENAEYDDCQTMPPEASTAIGIAAPTISFFGVRFRTVTGRLFRAGRGFVARRIGC